MKRLLAAILILALIISPAYGRKAKPKAGKFKDGVYTDAKYNFEIKINDNWKIEIEKAKSADRFAIRKKDPKIPPEFTQYPDAAVTPAVRVTVNEVEFQPLPFIDSLFSKSYSSKVKSKLMEKFEILEEGVKFDGFTNGVKKGITIDGKQAAYWTGFANYTFTMMGQSMPRKIGIGFMGIKNGNEMLIFKWGCENHYVKEISDEIIEIAKTTVWK